MLWAVGGGTDLAHGCHERARRRSQRRAVAQRERHAGDRDGRQQSDEHRAGGERLDRSRTGGNGRRHPDVRPPGPERVRRWIEDTR